MNEYIVLIDIDLLGFLAVAGLVYYPLSAKIVHHTLVKHFLNLSCQLVIILKIE